MEYNMSNSSYYAYCNAYVVCFVNDGFEMLHDIWCYDHAVKAGIIFG